MMSVPWEELPLQEVGICTSLSLPLRMFILVSSLQDLTSTSDVLVSLSINLVPT